MKNYTLPKYVPLNIPDAETWNKMWAHNVGMAKCVMSIVNNAAYVAMTDAVDKMKEEKLLKHGGKKFVNLALQAHEEYETRLKYYSCFNGEIDFFDPFGHPNLTRDDMWNVFLDVGAMAYKRNYKYAQFLQIAIFQEFTKKQIPHREALSYMVMATTLLDFSCRIFDEFVKQIEEHDHMKYRHILEPFRMTAVFHNFQKASMTIGRQVLNGEMLEFNVENMKDIDTAFRSYEASIMLDLETNESAHEALVENKEMMTKAQFREYLLNRAERKRKYMMENYGVEG